MYIQAPFRLNEFYQAIIRDELNVKDVQFIDDSSQFISYSFKPQLRTVGPKYGKLLGAIRTALGSLDGAAAMATLKAGEPLRFTFDGQDVELFEEDLLIETARQERYVSETEGTLTVILDTQLTDELIEEGFVREIVSKVQTMRKEAGFEVMDHIAFYAGANAKLNELIQKNSAQIMSDTLTDRIVTEADDTFYVKDWNINGEDVTFGVKKC
jgi:isoleucyl-tRNA synthetase